MRPTATRTATAAVTTGRAGRPAVNTRRASGLPWCLCNAVGGVHRGIEQGNQRNARNLFTDMR